MQLLYVKERIVSIQIEEKGLHYNQAAEVEAAFWYHGVLIHTAVARHNFHIRPLTTEPSGHPSSDHIFYYGVSKSLHS